MIFKIIGVGICTIVVSIVLKQYKPELSVLVNICGGLVIFMLAIDGVSTLVSVDLVSNQLDEKQKN